MKIGHKTTLYLYTLLQIPQLMLFFYDILKMKIPFIIPPKDAKLQGVHTGICEKKTTINTDVNINAKECISFQKF